MDLYLIYKTAGIVVFVAGSAYSCRKAGIPLRKAAIIGICAAVAGFAVSRLWFIIQHAFGNEPYVDDPIVAWNDAGSVLYGWILGGVLAVLLLSWIWKIKVIKIFDAIAPWMLVAQILNRFGCFAGECCWGKETHFFLRVHNQWLNQWVHPVQLYEAAWDAVLLLLVMRLGKVKEGRTAIIYFVGYAIGRFFLEFLRGDNKPALLGLTVPQLTSLIIINIFFLSLINSSQKNI